MAESYTTATLLATARDGLRDIGYQNDLLREDYEFVDILAQDQPRKIELAGFAQEPLSYRNACIGIAVPRLKRARRPADQSSWRKPEEQLATGSHPTSNKLIVYRSTYL